MRLNPEHLLTFARVAEAGSLSRAAEGLNLTQPAVSTQMQQLARAVGDPLFTRHRLGVSLTPAGRELLPHAQALARALDGAHTFVAGLRGLSVGQVRLAASPTIASYLLPGVLARYRHSHPGLAVTLTVEPPREAVARLVAGSVDLALVAGAVTPLPPSIESQLIRYDEIALVTLPGHPLAEGRRELPELAGLAVVWREVGSATREVAERALAGVALKPVLELVGNEAVKEAIAEGLGAAFLSRLAVEREVRAGLLAATQVNTSGLTRPLTLLRPPLALLSHAAQAFLNCLHAHELTERPDTSVAPH